MPEYMTIREAAAYLRLSPRTLARYVRAKKLRQHQPGGAGRPRFLREDLDRFAQAGALASVDASTKTSERGELPGDTKATPSAEGNWLPDNAFADRGGAYLVPALAHPALPPDSDVARLPIGERIRRLIEAAELSDDERILVEEAMVEMLHSVVQLVRTSRIIRS